MQLNPCLIITQLLGARHLKNSKQVFIEKDNDLRWVKRKLKAKAKGRLRNAPPWHASHLLLHQKDQSLFSCISRPRARAGMFTWGPSFCSQRPVAAKVGVARLSVFSPAWSPAPPLLPLGAPLGIPPFTLTPKDSCRSTSCEGLGAIRAESDEGVTQCLVRLISPQLCALKTRLLRSFYWNYSISFLALSGF